jgi:hypothetical protein
MTPTQDCSIKAVTYCQAIGELGYYQLQVYVPSLIIYNGRRSGKV